MEGWFVHGRSSLLIKLDCWCQSDCHQIEVNQATSVVADIIRYKTLVSVLFLCKVSDHACN